MFKRVADGLAAQAEVAFHFDGVAMTARAGDSVAAALLANGVRTVRHTPAQGSPRAPYCMMGVCFDCLVTIDGAANQQACLVPVHAGMVVRTQARPMPLAATSTTGAASVAPPPVRHDMRATRPGAISRQGKP